MGKLGYILVLVSYHNGVRMQSNLFMSHDRKEVFAFIAHNDDYSEMPLYTYSIVGSLEERWLKENEKVHLWMQIM